MRRSRLLTAGAVTLGAAALLFVANSERESDRVVPLDATASVTAADTPVRPGAQDGTDAVLEATTLRARDAIPSTSMEDGAEALDAPPTGPLLVSGELHDLESGQPVPNPGRVRLLPLGALDGREIIEVPFDGSGRFASRPIPHGDYVAEAIGTGFALTDEMVHDSDEEVHVGFPAYAGVEVQFDVRLPDGSQPAMALFADTGYQRMRSGLSERARLWMYARPLHLWTPSDPGARLGDYLGDDLHAVYFAASPVGSNPYDASTFCRYHSREVVFTTPAVGAVRVQLEDASAVVFAVTQPAQNVLGLERWLRAVRIAGCGTEDPAALVATDRDDWPWSLYSQPDFDWICESFAGDELDAGYLLPGRWLVAVGWDQLPPSVTREVEIVAGEQRVELEIGPPDLAEFVPVRYLVEGGLALDAAGGGDFCLVAPERERHVIYPDDWGSRSDGDWLRRSDLRAWLARLQPDGESEVRMVSTWQYVRRHGHPFAYLSAPLTADIEAIHLVEVPTATLLLGISQVTGVAQPLEVAFEPLAYADADAVAWGRRADLKVEQDPVSIDLEPRSEQAVGMPPLLPGRWRISVSHRANPRIPIVLREVDLVAGEQRVELTLPDLHELVVSVPGLDPGAVLRLRRPALLGGGSVGATPDEERSARLDDERRARFQGVPSGHHELAYGSVHAPMNVVVPCGEVVLELRRTNAFEVRLAPLENGAEGALARAGFASGDVLVDFNGRGLEDYDDLESLLDVITANQARVRVRRATQTLELLLGPMPDQSDPWATFDADFVPAWR